MTGDTRNGGAAGDGAAAAGTIDTAASAFALLRDSLAVWRVRGTVQAGLPPVVAIVRIDDGTTLRIEAAAPAEAPVRWWVRWPAQGGRPERSRPCASAVGLLRTVREALGAGSGARLRIASGQPMQA